MPSYRTSGRPTPYGAFVASSCPSIVDRFGTGYVTMDQVRQHYADPEKFNGYA